MTDLDRHALNAADLRQLARKRLPRGVFDFIDCGSEDDCAVVNNRASFAKYRFAPAVLKDVSKRSLKAPILGKPSELPLVVAPNRRCRPDVARRRGRPGESRSSKVHPVHRVDGVADIDRARCRRGAGPTVVPALHVARPRHVARSRQARAGRRF